MVHLSLFYPGVSFSIQKCDFPPQKLSKIVIFSNKIIRICDFLLIFAAENVIFYKHGTAKKKD